MKTYKEGDVVYIRQRAGGVVRGLITDFESGGINDKDVYDYTVISTGAEHWCYAEQIIGKVC